MNSACVVSKGYGRESGCLVQTPASRTPGADVTLPIGHKARQATAIVRYICTAIHTSRAHRPALFQLLWCRIIVGVLDRATLNPATRLMGKERGRKVKTGGGSLWWQRAAGKWCTCMSPRWSGGCGVKCGPTLCTYICTCLSNSLLLPHRPRRRFQRTPLPSV